MQKAKQEGLTNFWAPALPHLTTTSQELDAVSTKAAIF